LFRFACFILLSFCLICSDENLLAEKFTYIDNIIGPLDKEKYLEVFGEEYYVRDGFSSLDYGLQVRLYRLVFGPNDVDIKTQLSTTVCYYFNSVIQNFRVDPYDPYRVWVDTK
jgi:hypothetical protein